MDKEKYTLEYVKNFIEHTNDYFETNPEENETIYLMTGGTMEKIDMELFLKESIKNNINISKNKDGSFKILRSK